MHFLQKFFQKFIILFFLIFPLSLLSAAPSDNVRQFKLENGLTVFLLEDPSSPLIRFEYTVKAGFSSQTKETSGFFKLYSKVLQSYMTGVSFDFVECNADSTRFILRISPSQLSGTADLISEGVFNSFFSDDLIKDELKKIKAEVLENAESMGGFINTAIDSRVFSDSPWKHDSGVYPPLFSKTTDTSARMILQTIGERWYTPQNSALFISGNIDFENTKKILENTFGRFYSTYSIPVERPVSPVNNHRKFVLHNKEFSPELTQIVMQYTSLNIEETDVAAAVLNNDFSDFKTRLLNLQELNIPGYEYINAAAAHKRNSSRLIIQSLLQKPEGQFREITSLQQVQSFVDTVEKTGTRLYPEEFLYGKQQIESNLKYINTSSDIFMENLSAYWALEQYQSFFESAVENPEKSITAASLMSADEKLNSVTLSKLADSLMSEEPYIFVIINSVDYKKLEKEYKAAGFEEVTVKNASWYNQEIFTEKIETGTEKSEASNNLLQDNDFYARNISQFNSFTLTNGIPVTTKYNANTSGAALLIAVRGGKLNSWENHGFEEVMVNLLATNIQKEIVLAQQKGLIKGGPAVSNSSDLNFSYVVVECDSSDFAGVCKAVSNAMIYADIQPAVADRVVANRQYKKRLENGTAINQMYGSIVNLLLPKSPYFNVFETQTDILLDTTYNQILEGYPAFLDSSRYSIIVAGNFDETVRDNLNYTIGLLINRKTRFKNYETEITLPKNKGFTIKINHTFLTDIPAEKAGPMPAVLVPTTEFLDPVMYVFKVPPVENAEERAVFNSELMYLSKLVQEQMKGKSKLKNASASVILPYAGLDFGTLVIQNGKSTRQADAAVTDAIRELKKQMSSLDMDSILQNLRDVWIFSQLEDASTNAGTARLMFQGIEYFPENQNPAYYLEQYRIIENSKPKAFKTVSAFFPEKPDLRIYSKEAAK